MAPASQPHRSAGDHQGRPRRGAEVQQWTGLGGEALRRVTGKSSGFVRFPILLFNVRTVARPEREPEAVWSDVPRHDQWS